ncbi:response regulator transcription factor [Agromyces intestinalis]|uniref:Response regulator transcription factor n=1 Tax=Agromyces intestinalis TaxID=2592652 RepID=A0A5C1YDW9_9MICO|nr:response regulator transcription factor [Agromyces intestinalis]QEO14286.1 response regulator transcription factor [Agromyces intestinalis]
MRVLIVEDERELAETLAEGLRLDGFGVGVVHDGAAALQRLSDGDFDVVLLDRDLPVLSGDAVCRTLAAQGHPARILMLTAAGAVGDRVRGLDLGADDYLAKPFAYVELLARIRALGRRRGDAPADAVLERGGVRLDPVRRTAERDGRPVRLTRRELAVLEALLAADGGYLTPQRLLGLAWDEPGDHTAATVRLAVHTLRKKLGHPWLIDNSPGLGYRIE